MEELFKKYDFKKNTTNEYIFKKLKSYFKKDFEKVLDLIKDNVYKEKILNNLEQIVSSSKDYKITIENIKILKNVLIYSPFLVNIITKNPDYFLNYLFKNNNFKKIYSLDNFKTSLKKFCQKVSDFKSLQKYLRYFKQREFLRIGIQELNNIYNVEITAKQISHLAIAICDYSSKFIYNDLIKKFGAQNAKYIILGMGKLGAEELNYSSDIDLIYFTTDEPENKDFFKNFFDLFTKSISEITEDGFVFRIDLRLRPDGSNGPLFVSCENALFYYENWGKTWERGALLKANPIAGDIERGFKFLQELEPFIYRKSIDFGVIEDIKEIKQKINNETKNNESNVKLGKGGIREIEFIMQAIQLMYGGQDKSLREKNLIKFFKNLKHNRNFKILSDEEIDFLVEAYIFLRKVEHTIQIYQEKQTQNIPKSSEQQELLAFILRFSSKEEFFKKLNNYRSKVYEIFNNFFIFEEEKNDKKEFSEIVDFIEKSEKDKLISYLKNEGFSDSEVIAGILFHLKFPYSKKPLSQKEINEINMLISNLVNFSKPLNNHGKIFSYFSNLFDRIKFKYGYINYLNDNPEILKNILYIFSKSEYLGDILTKYMDIFEELYISNFIVQDKGLADYIIELEETLKKGNNYEDFMELIRIFKHKETIRIGIKFLNNSYRLKETLYHLTSLADAIFTKSVEIVLNEVKKRFGNINSDFTIIALGKYGGNELNFSSDLDIILVYKKDTISEYGLSSIEYFSKFLQRLISFLSVTTRNGRAYEIDTRLRPSGNAGALVCSFDSFKSYHEKGSEIWEVQALLRTRTIIGDLEVENFIKDLVKSRNINDEDIKEILRIRKRIEIEEGRENEKKINIKAGKGGIIDIEFLTQILMLKNKIIESNTFNALDLLFKNKILQKDDYKTLINSYRELRKVENILRLSKNKHTDIIEIDKFEKNIIKKLMKIKNDVRNIFNKFFLRGKNGYFER